MEQQGSIDTLLHDYGIESPTAYSSVERLYNEIKKRKIKLKRSYVENWLSKQPTYSLHRNRRIRFKRNYYNISNLDDLWQIDLIDAQKISRNNNGNKFILCVICCFSRFAWCVPIKRKTPNEVVRAFEHIFASTHRKPIKIQSDAGKEFLGRPIQQYFKEKNIQFHKTQDPVTKACIVERFIRTIKSIIYKYFTYTGKKRYIDVLDSLVYIYNNRKHTTIGMSPANVNEENVLAVWEHIQESRERKYARCRNSTKYLEGDTVRVANPKTVFEKGYTVKWSTDTYTIEKIIRKKPIVFRLRDCDGCMIKGNFYEHEIQLISQ